MRFFVILRILQNDTYYLIWHSHPERLSDCLPGGKSKGACVVLLWITRYSANCGGYATLSLILIGGMALVAQPFMAG